ncbi:MAG: nucleotidyltransferase domain-containing protein [Candidatus Nanohalobium sp.]
MSNRKTKHRKAFEEFAEKAQEDLGDSLKKLVLYGSVARGEESEGSDVDVFAVVEEGLEDELYSLAAKAGRKHEVHLAVIVRNPEEYELVRDSYFTREVMESGEAVI